jgi:hypothetical protein
MRGEYGMKFLPGGRESFAWVGTRSRHIPRTTYAKLVEGNKFCLSPHQLHPYGRQVCISIGDITTKYESKEWDGATGEKSHRNTKLCTEESYSLNPQVALCRSCRWIYVSLSHGDKLTVRVRRIVLASDWLRKGWFGIGDGN